MFPSQLLQTKLHRPAKADLVVRPRLLAALNHALTSKLTLVSAPAGFGKTTLVAQWASQVEPVAVLAWLSLDENDNDLLRFLSYLVAALQTLNPRIGQRLQEVLYGAGQPDPQTILTVLINDMVAVFEDSPDTAFVLILDDYHALESAEIDEALTFLLDHQPANLHVILTSRIDPALPLARLRVRGQMTEIRERDMRFTLEEAQAFLARRMALPLSLDQMTQVWTRTEGWIAGLQLAGLAIEGDGAQFVAEFTGTHRYILDYLSDEVFAKQPPDIQRFMLETSSLNRMCAELCDAVREETESQTFLEALERANLFIVPLDQARRWYRYHHLFADLLRQRASRLMPERVLALHHQASRWYMDFASETGELEAIDEAMGHAIHAKDPAHTAALLERCSDALWERGQHDKLRRWLSLLPESVLETSPRLGIFRAWLAFTAGQYELAHRTLTAAEKALIGSQVSELYGRIATTRAFIATFQGDIAATIQHARNALSLLADQTSTWHSSAAVALGDAYSLSGRLSEAEEAYRAALTDHHVALNLYTSLNAGFKVAGIHRQRGLLNAAYETCSRFIALAERGSLAQTSMAGCLYALRGDILCEWNQIPEALAQTQQAMDASHNAPHIGFVAWIHLYRIRCLLAARDFEQAARTLDQINTLGQSKPLPPWIVSPLEALRALLMLVQGDQSGLAAWVKDRGLSLDGSDVARRDFEYLTFARLLALQGRLDEALSLLDRLLEASRSMGRASISLIVLISKALLLNARHQTDEALDALVEALRIGQVGGFIRAFADGGAPMLALLKLNGSRGISSEYSQRLLTAFSANPVLRPSVAHPDSLSEREMEVLDLIANGLKNQDIADQLVISLNTVLYHTKNIYSKLGVTHRTQAVQRARDIGLL